MKNNFSKLFFTALTLVLCFGCSNEKEVVTNEDITIEGEVTNVNGFPENVISAEEYLAQKGIVAKTKNNQSLYRVPGPSEVLVYEKYFIVYPPQWKMNDRLKYLQDVRKHREVLVVLDDCDFVDTWMIQVVRQFPPRPNKSKNVVVTATTTNTDLDNLDEGEDEPGATEGSSDFPDYNSCDEVPLPPIYDGLIFKPFDSGDIVISGPIGGDGINTPIE